MSSLKDVCSNYVLRGPGGSLPEINGVIAGYTDRNKTQFLMAQGVTNIETNQSVSNNGTLGFYSCTKSITAMAVLILWDRGELDLDVPAKTYLPILDEFGIIEDGQVDEVTGELKYPPVRAKNDVTIRNLLLHMSGFAYIITNASYLSIFMKKNLHSPLIELFKPSVMPLIFEPGTDWLYGHNFDWLGLIVEKISGQKLSEFLQKYIFLKADITSFTFQMTDSSKMIQLHDKSDNVLKLFKGTLPIPLTAEIDMGGHGCFGTVDDYLKFLRIWLNFGTSPDTGTEILSRTAVEYAVQNHLPPGQVTNFPMPFLDASDGYSLIGCGYGAHELETGRPAGSLYWAGLANLYFWIDLKNGCAGFWGCQILPFMDDACVKGFKEFEAAVYRDLQSKAP